MLLYQLVLIILGVIIEIWWFKGIIENNSSTFHALISLINSLAFIAIVGFILIIIFYFIFMSPIWTIKLF